ncbi:MAG: UDP-N-acetylglucosamine 1-carboxyvinyltransferase [Bacilli bacterium]|nr:UDP-N-acetylglucosamine 1-carboxyvinyltransferase [Bacilli bacterium]
MEILKIYGGKTLKGSIEIGGAKNSAVALVPAAILSDKVVINNVPNISDIEALKKILSYLNVSFENEGDKFIIDSTNLENKPITLEHSKMLRASYYFAGALLGKYKHAEMYFPGGCVIGSRPIDLHFYGFEKLGAKVTNEGDKFIIEASELIGSEINLKFASVGATINILLAAVYAKGKTIIKNAAKEPEVGTVIDFLNSMGAKITGKDTSMLVIEGVSNLSGGNISVIPDRIEAGTYIIAGVMNGDNLKIKNVIPEHFKALTDKLLLMGADIKVYDDYVVASKSENLKPIRIETEVYPGFPTDLQQPMTSLLTMASGKSIIVENIYENRFQNIPYLNKMGANIEVSGRQAIINGPTEFKPGEVITTDLRAGAALILAALCAPGETKIKEVKHVLRGYENIINKLTKIGVKITLEDE